MSQGDVQGGAKASAEYADIEAAVDEAIATCGGDPRAAIRALLIEKAHLDTTTARLAEVISFGFAYGRYRRVVVDRKRTA